MVFLILDICGITNYSRNIEIEKSTIYYDSKLASMFLGKLGHGQPYLLTIVFTFTWHCLPWLQGLQSNNLGGI